MFLCFRDEVHGCVLPRLYSYPNYHLPFHGRIRNISVCIWLSSTITNAEQTWLCWTFSNDKPQPELQIFWDFFITSRQEALGDLLIGYALVQYWGGSVWFRRNWRVTIDLSYTCVLIPRTKIEIFIIIEKKNAYRNFLRIARGLYGFFP